MCTTLSIFLQNTVPSNFMSRLGSQKLSRLLHHHHHHHQHHHHHHQRQRLSFQKYLANIVHSSYIERAGIWEQSRPFVTARTGITSGSLPGALSKQQAKDLAVRLTSDEREVLISALQECQSQKTRAEYEGQLAAFRWRSKFGRPSRVPSLGDVDPTGSYCAVPEDWLLRKYVETVPQPCRKDLIRVAVANAIPFIGFGFLDNFIMIVAGDQIETSLGTIITVSTMAAAAIGNTISDILGIGSAFYVERLAQRIGFQPPKLTPMQLDLPICRRAANLGRVVGVTIGCTLGMTPLLILHSAKAVSIG